MQAYAYAAYREMADLYARLGEPEKERAPRARAERVRQLFIERLAMGEDGESFWAMGLDSEKRKIETVTSNPAILSAMAPSSPTGPAPSTKAW